MSKTRVAFWEISIKKGLGITFHASHISHFIKSEGFLQFWVFYKSSFYRAQQRDFDKFMIFKKTDFYKLFFSSLQGTAKGFTMAFIIGIFRISSGVYCRNFINLRSILFISHRFLSFFHDFLRRLL